MYSPTLGKWMQMDPAGYVDGHNIYQFEHSSPPHLLDPLGLSPSVGNPVGRIHLPGSLDNNGPVVPGAGSDAGKYFYSTNDQTWMPVSMAQSGSGTWGTAPNLIHYTWTMQDVSAKADLQHAMGTSGKSVFTVIKVKQDGPCPFDRFSWIQFSEARQNGQVYVPPNGWPWKGIDRYPNGGGRTDNSQATFLPNEQTAINAGNGYGGRVSSLYDSSNADTIFIDWASSGVQRTGLITPW